MLSNLQLLPDSEFHRYTTLIYQFPSWILGKAFKEESFFLQFEVYKFTYTFQPFFFLLISFGLLKFYKKQFYYDFVTIYFFLVQTFGALFPQSISQDSSSLILPCTFILLFHRNSRLEIFAYMVLTLMITFGYETGALCLLLHTLFSFYKIYVKKEKIYFKYLLVSATGGAILVYNLITSNLETIITKQSDLTHQLPSGVILVLTIFIAIPLFKIINSLLNHRIISNGINLFLFVVIVSLINIHHQVLSTSILEEVFYLRIYLIVLIIPLILMVFLCEINQDHLDLSRKDIFLKINILIVSIFMTSVVLKTAKAHKEATNLIINEIKLKRGCLFNSDSGFYNKLRTNGIFLEFVPYYSILLQKTHKPKSILFTPFFGWDELKDKMITTNICYTKDRNKKRFTFFKSNKSEQLVLLNGSQIDVSEIFN